MSSVAKKQGPGKKKAVAVVIFGFISGLILPAGATPPEKRDIVSVEKTPRLAARLQPLGLDQLFEWEGRIYILVGPTDIWKLDQNRIPYLIESHKFPALNTRPSLLQSGINGDYHSYLELEADLQALERAYPRIARLFTIGVTLENRRIYALKISDNVALDEEEAEVLFLGCHHAREWISVEVPFLLAKYLLENYASDAGVRRAVDESEV